jgi:leucyl/phenylalanyl-tRNA--protein transferase
MKRVFNKGIFKVTFDNDFAGVIKNCKKLRENKEGTWITDEMMAAYINLHKNGFASSVEVYKDDKLVGGLYGVKIGKCFFGESMFSTETNASKVALISMCRKLEKEGFIFLDCQMHTNHLESMGGKFVSWEDFKLMLNKGIY